MKRVPGSIRDPAGRLVPKIKSLDALLAEPDTPVRYRIDKLRSTAHGSSLSAQYKAGKSTIVII